ncbi:MAG: hypothetical protein Q9181_002104 [Wetmoreana brouardii]
MHFQNFPSLVLAGLAASVTAASATRLYVSSYAGTITTLNLTHTANASYHLTQLGTNNACAPNASWLQIDVKHRNLFCLDEGISVGNGTLSSFKIKDDKPGSLSLVNHAAIPNAPVDSAIIYGKNGTQLLAVAHYAWALTTWKLDPVTAAFTQQQSFNFTQPKPGPNAARQAAPHPHQVRVDPQGKYLVVPDLGSDLIRIFYVDRNNLTISERPSISVTPGSGPRHGVFHISKPRRSSGTATPSGSKRGEVYYYLVSELSSTLTGYKVSYLPNHGGLQMNPVSTGHAYGPSNATVFSSNAPSEIVVAPSGDQLIVSNRNATFFEHVKNPDPNNSTQIASDTLATFSLSKSPMGEAAKFTDLTPAGGSFPRHFSLNHDGSLVAVGLQNSGRVAIYERCTKTGKIGKDVVADFEGLGAVTSIVWDEHKEP